MDELFEFLVLIAERLDQAQIPYMLSGSVALSMYAQPRMTRDIDFVVDIEQGQVDKFVDLFKEDCYIDRESVLEAVRTRGMFNIIHEVWVIKADFVVRKDRPFRKTEFDRRRTVSGLPWKKWTGYLCGLSLVQEMPLFEVVRAEVAKRRVKAVRVVPALDVAGDGVLDGTSGRPALSVQELGLDAREEALDDGVVPAVAFATHRAHDAVSMKHVLVGVRRVLHAAVRVMHESRFGHAAPERHA